MTSQTENHQTTVTLDQLQEIATIVMQAAEADTLEQVLQRIAHAARKLVGARYAALGIPDGNGGLRHFKVSGITEDEIALISHPPQGLGLLGTIMNEREVIMLDDMCQDPRAVGFPSGHPDMRSLLGAPVQAGGELFGMLYLSDLENEQPFELRHRWLVETLAGYAALAIAGSNLRQNQRRLTLMEERQRISMELHDGVIQSLYAVGMHLDLMQRGIMARDSLEEAIYSLNEVIEDVRGYINNLKAPGHDTISVRDHLENIIAHLYIPQTLNVSLDAPSTPPPMPDHEFDSLCMVTREALSNVVRHSGARNLTVRCNTHDDTLHLLIRDDGKGFEPGTNGRSGGLGLQNMRARVRQLNGQFHMESAPGEGTMLLIHVPVSEKNNQYAKAKT